MSTALYRRYRPDTFDEVIGQEHVTEPLKNALRKDKVNHAYLFSGPRGCGKTTSARILARCLNCAQGPTPTPCGTCDSCVELATGGPGSLDVIEIDAASHGGVDDARDLRERATFAPTRDRYKIFIVDEAHMVSSAGFNALLKIVEEPPEHIKFIFATTEPDKVIGTIRSRTHHYPFRLVPPEPLMNYLEGLASAEQVNIAAGVLSLAVRAGGGSVRDTLSVLDQLIAGATQDGVSYDLAVNLLGFTPESLLDDVVDSLAASDSETVFRVVDRVIQSGQDPRRFVEDLLERLRDLVVVKAMRENAPAVLHGVSEDQIRRLHTQASQLGPGEISRAADTTAQALTEMVGATSPKLHLELLMARLMLPTADDSHRGLVARVERLERGVAGAPQPHDQEPDEDVSGAAMARAALRPTAEELPPAPEVPQDSPQVEQPPQQSPPAQAGQAPQATHTAQGAQPAQPAQQAPQFESTQPAQQPSSPAQPSPVETARRAWPDVLTVLEGQSRLIWMTIKDNASIVSFDGHVMTIGFTNDGARGTAQNRGGEELLAEAYLQVLNIQPRFDFVTGGGSPPTARGARDDQQAGRGNQRPKAESRPAAEAAPTKTPPVKPTQTSPAAPPPSQQLVPSREQPKQQPQPQQQQPLDRILHVAPESGPEPAAEFAPQSASEAEPEPQKRPDAAEAATVVAEFQPSAQELADQQDEDIPPPWDEEPEENFTEHTQPRSTVSAQTQPTAPPPVPDPEPRAQDGYAGFIPTPERTENPSIPVFAKPEAELRADFARRFGDIIPDFAHRTDKAQRQPPGQSHTKPAAQPDITQQRQSDTSRTSVQSGTRTSGPGTSDGPAEHTMADKDSEHGVGANSRFPDMMEQFQRNVKHNTVVESPVHHVAPSQPSPSAQTHPGWGDEEVSDDDVHVENSQVAGRAVVERILNARLIEELNPDGTPKL